MSRSIIVYAPIAYETNASYVIAQYLEFPGEKENTAEINVPLSPDGNEPVTHVASAFPLGEAESIVFLALHDGTLPSTDVHGNAIDWGSIPWLTEADAVAAAQAMVISAQNGGDAVTHFMGVLAGAGLQTMIQAG